MENKLILLKFVFIFELLIKIINSEDEITFKNQIIQLAGRQGYNITNSQDKFFNDICQTFTSENKKDVSLEYRRKYYYYPLGKQIINNSYDLKKIFTKQTNSNIFLCFNLYSHNIFLFFNKSLYFILPIFIFQIVIIIIYLSGKYKKASTYTPEEYNNYIQNKNRKNLYKFPNYNIYSMTSSNNFKNDNSKDINNNQETFTRFRDEEEKNNYLITINNDKNNINNMKEETINSGSKKENKHKKLDTFISQTLEIDDNKITEAMKKELINSDENKQSSEENKESSNDNKQSSEKKENEEEKEKNSKSKIQNKFLNSDEIYTFGGIKLDNINSNEEEEEKKENEKEIESEEKKNEQMNYVYSKINNKINNNQIKSKGPIIEKEKEINLVKEELYYYGFNVVILQDKRTFKEIYFDLLSHCSIIFYFLPNFFIYEDRFLTMLYYTIKIYLYFIFLFLIFINTSTINLIYDNELNYFEYYLRCLLVIILVNVLSQFVFMLTNSKRMFIKYMTKIENSFFYKKRFIKFIKNDIIDLINFNLFLKILFLLFIIIILFSIVFFFSICLCVAYYNTQFIILKSILICCLFSQIFPFILVIIPAKIRKKAIEKKNNNLFIFSKVIDSYFLP